MYKAVSSGRPASFSAQLKFCGETHTHGTRSVMKQLLVIPQHKTKLLKRTVLYRVSVEWNKLPNSARSSKRAFELHLKETV